MRTVGPKSDSPFTLPFPVTSGAPRHDASLGPGLPNHTYSEGPPAQINTSVSYFYALAPDPVFNLTLLRRGHLLFRRCHGGKSSGTGVRVHCADLASINRHIFESYVARAMPHRDLVPRLDAWETADELMAEFRFLTCPDSLCIRRFLSDTPRSTTPQTRSIGWR